MPLIVGTRLGPYEVKAPLGAGGMGEVYRARDTKLGRDVAIKVLPREWEQDPDRLARIDREARVLASLNHPNIAALFGYEEDAGVRYLAMELVPGDTLADRVAAGPVPVREALDVGRQIAEALEQAHALSVIHRDLKPANVKVTPEGRVKVLDFGLAKVLRDARDDVAPTVTMDEETSTRDGLVVGTASYMSPEQARGQPLDTRTDVWSFGCVLYEMLTGRRAFRGPTLSDILAAVLEHEADWTALPVTTPPAARTLLRRCLERDRRRRLQSMGDARLELEEALQGSGDVSAAEAPSALRSRAPLAVSAAVAAVGLAAGLAAGYGLNRRPLERDAWVPKRLVLPVPKDTRVRQDGVAVSPDGDRVAYVAGTGDTRNVYVQELTAFEPRAVKGAEGSRLPSFSPDGRWLAFQSKGFYQRVPVEGGQPITICAAPAGAPAAAWPRQDLLLFQDPSTGALMSAAANGGTPEVFVRIEGLSIGAEPDPLPDGKGVLLTLRGLSGDTVAVLDLNTRRWKKLRDAPARWPHYIPTGHLLYNATADSGGPGPAPPARWVVAPFDIGKLEVTGDPVDVLGDLRTGGYEPGWVTPHGSGILAYRADPSAVSAGRPLEWIASGGARVAIDTGGREFVPYSVALSPDAERLAVSIKDGTAFDLWVSDLQRGTWLRLTFDGQSGSPLWSPDGTRIAYASGRDGKDLYWVAADGGGTPELLTKAGTAVLRPTSFSPDGRRLLFAKGKWEGPPRYSGVSLHALDLEGDRIPRVFIEASYSVSFGAFSPDGRWIAFVTLESGRPAVYLRAADLTGRRWALSKAEGIGPAWSRTGREVFFEEGSRLVSVPVSADTGPGEARVVLANAFREGGWAERSFEVGQGRFVIWQMPAVDASRDSRVVVIPNWLDEVRARTHAARR